MPSTKTPPLFQSNELEQLDPHNIPRHIAMIADGNRRWARREGIDKLQGHYKGAENLIPIVNAAKEIGIETVTVYTFSTENWNRTPEEVEVLMDVIASYLETQRERMINEGIRLTAIGDPSKLPEKVTRQLKATQEATSKCDEVTLVLALNYGGRDEITRAVKQIVAEKIPANEINEQIVSQHLDTAPYGDPELMIRPGNNMRISNFLLWQLSYAEIIFTDKFWPEISPHDLLGMIKEYQKRDRRKGR